METKIKPKKKNRRTVESWALTYGKPGLVFYTSMTSNGITAVASNNNRKISITRMVAVAANFNDIKAIPIYQVTIVE